MSYKGLILCPGHPDDGKWMTHHSRLHRAYERPRCEEPYRRDMLEGREEAIDLKVFTLRWHEGLRFAEGRSDFSIIPGMWLDTHLQEDPQIYGFTMMTRVYATARAVGRALEEANFVPTYRHGQALNQQLLGVENGGTRDN